VRNVLNGAHTFNEIAAGAPGLSRTLLTRRLHELERAGVIVIRPKPDGHGSNYEPTAAGRGPRPVLDAIADWAEDWIEVTPEHADPGVVLWSWCHALRGDTLPERRVVVRFEFEHRGRRMRSWLLIDRGEGEVCNFDPGFGEDLVVAVKDPVMFARWHLGLVSWAAALDCGAIEVSGPPRWAECCRPGTAARSSSPSAGAMHRRQRRRRRPASKTPCDSPDGLEPVGTTGRTGHESVPAQFCSSRSTTLPDLVRRR
jgi:DNA-binding HxlR family transcriptional regulator